MAAQLYQGEYADPCHQMTLTLTGILHMSALDIAAYDSTLWDEFATYSDGYRVTTSIILGMTLEKDSKQGMCFASSDKPGGVCQVIEGDGVTNGNMQLNGHTLTYIDGTNWNPSALQTGTTIASTNAIEFSPNPQTDLARADAAALAQVLTMTWIQPKETRDEVYIGIPRYDKGDTVSVYGIPTGVANKEVLQTCSTGVILTRAETILSSLICLGTIQILML